MILSLGAVDRTDADAPWTVITEDHYIDYLARTDIALYLAG